MARGEIRYFVDYCKSNEIILEEKKKLFYKNLINNNGLLGSLVVIGVSLYILSLIQEEVIK